ncbi:hypothetical protein V2A60_001121 [Cordyceps javanica]
MDIGEAVGARFGVLDTHEPNVVFPAVHSLFFYAMFNVCNVNDEARLDFDKFRTFDVEPVDPVYGDMRRMRFNLMAIIKFRSQHDGVDSIRLYHVDGHHICPESSLPYANPEWKFADFVNGDTFFALYARSWYKPKESPSFPEVSMMGDEDPDNNQDNMRSVTHLRTFDYLMNRAQEFAGYN